MVDKNPNECAVCLEAALMVFRHDLLGIDVPDFKDITVNNHLRTIKRKWYDDKWHTSLTMPKPSDFDFDSESSESEDDTEPLGCCLRVPYSRSRMYNSWRRAFKIHDINSLHVCHLPRTYQSFILQLIGSVSFEV